MKFTDYPSTNTLVEQNVLLVDGPNGTKKITAKDLMNALIEFGGLSMDLMSMDLAGKVESNSRFLIAMPDGTNKAIKADDVVYELLDGFIPLEQRRNTFRGKNLGTSFTAEQKARIKDGTFKGFFIGDFWTINSIVWRIADINYWMGCGDTECTTPHLVIMPDHTLYNAVMNSSNTTNGGYVGSQMYTANLASAKTTINTAFGATNILKHRELLTNAVTSGYPSGGSWCDSTVELPNEIMMYGSYVHTPAGDGTIVPYIYTINKTQLSLMKIHPKFINPHRENQWLRDVVSGAFFAYVDIYGGPDYANASGSLGVRPVFGVVG